MFCWLPINGSKQGMRQSEYPSTGRNGHMTTFLPISVPKSRLANISQPTRRILQTIPCKHISRVQRSQILIPARAQKFIVKGSCLQDSSGKPSMNDIYVYVTVLESLERNVEHILKLLLEIRESLRWFLVQFLGH